MTQKIFLSLIFAIALAGCKNEPYIVKSTLEIKQNLPIKDDNARSINLTPGNYPADLNINSSRVKVTVKTASKNNVTFRLKLPKNMKLPTNGTLELTSAQSGQAFNTNVNVTTQIENGPKKREYENCTVEYTDYDCFPIGNPPRTICQPVTRTRWGRRDVEYYLRNYHRTIEAQLVGTDNSTLAQINGSRVDSERVYTREGFCY